MSTDALEEWWRRFTHFVRKQEAERIDRLIMGKTEDIAKLCPQCLSRYWELHELVRVEASQEIESFYHCPNCNGGPFYDTE